MDTPDPRYRLTLSTYLGERLSRIAQADGLTLSEVVAKAFALYDVARTAQDEGARLGIFRTDATGVPAIERELVNL